MIQANKLREIAIRSQFNLYDEQLRILNEEMKDAAEKGDLSFTINSFECGKTSFDYSFWFEGAKLNTENWQKINKTLSELGYTISFNIISFDNMKITVFW